MQTFSFRLFGSRNPLTGKQPRVDSDYDVLAVASPGRLLDMLVRLFGSPGPRPGISERIIDSNELSTVLEEVIGDEALRKSAKSVLELPEDLPINAIDIWLYIPAPGELFALRLNWNNQDIELVSGVMGLGYDGEIHRAGEYYEEVSRVTMLG